MAKPAIAKPAQKPAPRKDEAAKSILKQTTKAESAAVVEEGAKPAKPVKVLSRAAKAKLLRYKPKGQEAPEGLGKQKKAVEPKVAESTEAVDVPAAEPVDQEYFQPSDNESEADEAATATPADEKTKKFDDEIEKTIKAKLPSTPAADSQPAVVYLGHIPYGFFEDQMRGYFSQFGKVLRLRLSRSPKTGESRGYAFIEFAHKAVADVVVETMDNYLLYSRILKCCVIPPEKVHPSTFDGITSAIKVTPRRIKANRQYNKPRTPEQVAARVKRITKTEDRKRKRLHELGIEYEIPSIKQQVAPSAKHFKFTDD